MSSTNVRARHTNVFTSLADFCGGKTATHNIKWVKVFYLINPGYLKKGQVSRVALVHTIRVGTGANLLKLLDGLHSGRTLLHKHLAVRVVVYQGDSVCCHHVIVKKLATGCYAECAPICWT